jgi:CheY-like chemotaxis protein
MTEAASIMPKPRVLLVEDEVMVAIYIEDVLADLGCDVVGVATNLVQGLALARARDVEFAVLDINLGGDMSFPVADVLRERKIPFLFVSGYTSAGLVEEYRNEVRLRKPFRTPELASAIERLRSI